MGPCLLKFLTYQEDEEDDDRNTEFMVPVAEVSRNAASDSALVITQSHFKFSATAVGENMNNAMLLPQYGEEDFSHHPMKTGFQCDCKLFTWPSPEV